MANPVSDPLTNWKNDADGGDNNNPQDGDLVAATTTTALAGNLRRIKSEVRQFTTDPVWVDYANIPVPGGGGIVGALPTLDATREVLSFTGDWTGVTHTGRVIRVSFGTSPVTYAISRITSSVIAGGITQVSVIPPVPAGTISAVEFSALDSPLTGAGGLNPFPLTLANPVAPALVGFAHNLVVPALQGGTGRTNLNLGGDVSGDLTDHAIADITALPVTVIGIQGNPVLAGVPLPNQALAWNGAAWQGISVLMSLTATTLPTKGTIVLPTGTSPLGSAPLQIKWLAFQGATTLANTVVTTLTAQNWDSPFPNGYLGGVVSVTVDPPNSAIFATLTASTSENVCQIAVTNLTQMGNDGSGFLVIDSGAIVAITFDAFVIAIGN